MLAVLPAQFGQLTQLKCLDLSHNGISGIPAVCFMGLTQLEKLWLGGNALTSLGVDIGAMLSLRELHLSHNRLTALPPEIASLKQLKVLAGRAAGPPEHHPVPEQAASRLTEWVSEVCWTSPTCLCVL